ncbi:hypothetical protein M8J75_010847 [Diaphorina citri]|nr:hypothetical protein M8J75_010847 [Diaphorina citri]
MATDIPDHEQEYLSLEYDYYDLQKPTKTPPSFDVTEEEEGEILPENFPENSHHENVPPGGEPFVIVSDDEADDIDLLNLEESVTTSAASEALEELLNADPCIVETEFVRGNKGRPGVRVKFQDLSKPYVSQVTMDGNYMQYLHIVRGMYGEEANNLDLSPDSGINDLQNLSPEEQEKQKAEWTQELARVEEEINTLKHVLASKTKTAQDLKKKLGFTVWKEFNDDLTQSIKNVKETQVYQSAESLVKPVAEKATNILGGFGSGISTKLGQIKSSESFRSFEEKVGNAYENVKTKVSTSRSISMQSFDEALAAGSGNITSPASTPVIPEEKEIK